MSADCITIELQGPNGTSLVLGDLTTDPLGLGIEWEWSAFPGWWETPTGLLATNERGLDGQNVSKGKNLGRSMTLQGAARIPDGNPGAIYRAMNFLSALCNSRRRPGLVLVNEDTAMQAQVWSPSPNRYAQLGERQVLEFDIPLFADDPRKYSQAEHTAEADLGDGEGGPTTVEILNSGTEDTPWVCALNGGWDTQARLRYLTSSDGDVDETDTVTLTGAANDSSNFTLDAKRQTIFGATGNNRYDLYDPSVDGAAWYYFKPGFNVVRFSRVDPVGSAAAVFTWRDAFV